jgi:tricarballylate dehydrogenase
VKGRENFNMFDVIIAGGGNAAFSAAHAAHDAGARRILLLEKAPREWIGGNSYFTAGAMRTTFASLDDLRPLFDDFSDEDAARTAVEPYQEADFRADMERVTEGRCDPELAEILVGDAAGAVRWMREKGFAFRFMPERQAFEIDGKHHYWGGLYIGTVGGGEGLMAKHLEIAAAEGIEIRCESPVVALIQEQDGVVSGVVVDGPAGREEIRAKAVVLASGGFEADPRRRAQFLGPGWDVAKVRGTPYNTGEGIEMALAAGAQPYGHWSGCHSIAWDAGAPPSGDLELTNRFSRQSYPIGIVVNRDGKRFVDEGADLRNYTYAKYGAEILKQPGAIAYQLFDATTEPMLRHIDYSAPGMSRIEAGSIGELAEKIGVNQSALEETVRAYNAAVQPGEFNPAVRDGKRTVGITPPKSNWALPLDRPPFVAFSVTCGITFTYGGVRVDGQARVLDTRNRPIPGLHAAGELVGGLFYFNYPGGSGLTSGTVFGRRAGRAAAGGA